MPENETTEGVREEDRRVQFDGDREPHLEPPTDAHLERHAERNALVLGSFTFLSRPGTSGCSPAD